MPAVIIPVQPAAQQTTWLYHVAPVRLRDTIRRDGLTAAKPSGRWGSSAAGQPFGLYGWCDEDLAYNWLAVYEEPSEIWAAEVLLEDVRLDPIIGGARYVSADVPAGRLRLIES